MGADLRKHNIAVVDDDPMILKVFSSLMAQNGYHADFFQDALQAVDKILASPDRYKLLLLDIQMPQISGVQMAQIVRAVLPDLQIIFITGGVPEEVHQSALALGNVDFIEKPFSLPDILKKFEAKKV